MYSLQRMDNYFILSSHFQNNKNTPKIDKSIIGGKAYGLFKYIENDTLPFIVIKSNLYKIWSEDKDKAQKILENISIVIKEHFETLNINNYIVRSSAKFETSKERGNYLSSDGNITNNELLSTIVQIWEQNQSICDEFIENSFALIIQEYVKPVLTGHLSNERRVSRNTNDWIIEYYDQEGLNYESERIKYNPKKDYFVSNFKCKTILDLKKILISLPYYFQNIKKIIDLRCHIEWVWDGTKLWLVQYDIDETIENGTEPGSEWSITNIVTPKENLECLRKLSSIKEIKWSKTKCIQTFIDLDLPFGEIYILDNPDILEALYNNNIPQELKTDLEWLLEYPIVIRTDVNSTEEYSRVLLPRTDAIFKIEESLKYLEDKVNYFVNEGVKFDGFCFLIHRFILSKSCALAFAKPNIPKTRIDSTWGIVDGLYYHPHDSFEISTKDGKVKKLIRCKNEYLDVKSDGTWFSKKAGNKYDWKESLTKTQLQEIADYTTKIANRLNMPITVMYFVDIDKYTGYKNILPWFYTTEEITENREKFSDSIFSNDYILIEKKLDLTILNENDRNFRKKQTIKLRPNAEIIREKKIVEDIADFALKYNIPVELDGSILAHPYYILRKKGVRVKCTNYFDPKYGSKNFYKLVRDKISVNIESKGEKTNTVKVEPEKLLIYLKEKAIEEALEFYWEKTNDDAVIEELADLFEIIRSSSKVLGSNIIEIEDIANKKAESKGAFESGILLLDTTEYSLINTIERVDNTLFNNEPINGNLPTEYKRSIKKSQRISIDNSVLNIPYICSNPQSIRLPLSLSEHRIIEVTYNAKNISIKFLRDKRKEDPDQLTIEFPQ